MKKFLINNYYAIVMLLYIIFNVVLMNFKISGPLYLVNILFLNIVNIIVLFKYRNDIFNRAVIIFPSLILLFFSRDIYQFCFLFTNTIISFIKFFIENKNYRSSIITVVVGIPVIIFLFFLSDKFILSKNEEKDLHLSEICENEYKIYFYVDQYNDSRPRIEKNVTIINSNLLHISYSKREDISYPDYQKFSKKHKCKEVSK